MLGSTALTCRIGVDLLIIIVFSFAELAVEIAVATDKSTSIIARIDLALSFMVTSFLVLLCPSSLSWTSGAIIGGMTRPVKHKSKSRPNSLEPGNQTRLTIPDLVILSLLAECLLHGYEVIATLEYRKICDWKL